MLGQKRFGKFQTAALVVIALVMGANLISPAVAHFKPKLGHLIKHVFTKADPRYINVGEKATSAATADNATNAANADKLDGLDSTALVKQSDRMTVAWVVSDAAGTILRQSGGWTVTKLSGSGRYTVDHPNVNESQIGYVGSTFREPGAGTDPGFVSCFANDANGFQVRTFNSAGSAADSGFSLAAPFVNAAGNNVARTASKAADSDFSQDNT